jgi:tRNA(adenine34) deaminase
MTACVYPEPGAGARLQPEIDIGSIPLAVHEHFMRMAIAEARGNPSYPFGSVIMRARDSRLMAAGVNDSRRNPTLHGEIVAMNDYVSQHGNQGWDGMILYTTGEPCPMCSGALIWAGIGGVVFGTSIAQLARIGFNQIGIAAASVIRSAPFYRGALLGGILAAETDRLFADRPCG